MQKYLSKGAVIFLLPAILLATLVLLAIPRFHAWRRHLILNQVATALAQNSGAQNIDDFDARIDHLRAYINDNSCHNIDAEFYAIWRDQIGLAQEVLRYSKHLRKTLPHMECSTRADLLGQIAVSMGYKIRNIVLYDIGNNLDSHRVVDILNPETGRWETQDPDYDVYWAAKTGSRASLTEVLAAPDNYQPCGRLSCGWDHKSREGINAMRLHHFIGIITVDDKPAGKRLSLYGPATDPAKNYQLAGKIGTFCEVLPRQCKDGFTAAKASYP